jgi:hypothetical protein
VGTGGSRKIGLRYAELVEMARPPTAIYKHAAKEIRVESPVTRSPSMAKWDERYARLELPHSHEPVGRATRRCCRRVDIFRWFPGRLDGAHRRELFAFYAPYPASYKRYVAGSFAPTGIAWSHDNRTAGFRIVGHGPSLRIECRAPGADANPYLAFAATLAAGLDGIENKIEPPPAFEGDVYAAQELPHVPHSLNESIAALEASTFARSTFGDDVIGHYLHFFKTEQRKFDSVVTDWERRRYFEMDDMRLANKVALITGGGSGIGKASCLRFAQEGAKVVVVDLKGADGTVDEIKVAGGEAAAFSADISKAKDCEAMVAFAEKTYGKLDLAFNNAGVFHPKDDSVTNTTKRSGTSSST